jgi:hypothetical protein
MIRAFKGKYIRFEDEGKKRKDHLLIVEILNRKMDLIQVIVCNETELLLAMVVENVTEISGYHRYQPKSDTVSPFGIGGLSKLRTDHKEGMLEGIAAQSRFDYNQLAINFGKGLLKTDEMFVQFVDE